MTVYRFPYLHSLANSSYELKGFCRPLPHSNFHCKWMQTCGGWGFDIAQGRVPERPFTANPGWKFCSTFCIYLPMHCLEQRFVLSFLFFFFFLKWKRTTVFWKFNYVFLDKKTMLKILLNPGLNLTIFQGSGPRLRDTFSGQNRFEKLRPFWNCLHVKFCFRIISLTPTNSLLSIFPF